MPGITVPTTIFKGYAAANIEQFKCVKCHLLLKDPVQTACGHRFCKSCADEMIKKENQNLPRCPDCNELFDDEDGAQYFPDRFVRRELNNLVVTCPFSGDGCDWEGKFSEYENHINRCSFAVSCEYCKKSIHKNQLASHQQFCPDAPKPCPLAMIGCKTSNMTKEKLQQHMAEAHSEHMRQIVAQLKSLEEKVVLQEMHTSKRGETTPFYAAQYDIVESDAPKVSNLHNSGLRRIMSSLPSQPRYSKPQYYGQLQDVNVQTSVLDSTRLDMAMQRKLESVVTERVGSLTEEMRKILMAELKVKNNEVERLQGTVAKLEKTVKLKNAELEDRDFRLSLIENSNHDGSMIWKIPQFSQRKADAENGKYTSISSLPFCSAKLEKTVKSKNAELEDRDFRLSLIENSNHDGSMIWKIPQFSQRKADAENGKYTSISSLPFYTGRHGFKMCLRLYIMGDLIGKGTHLSLFFVVMCEEFDNNLQWPSIHKVTFKLINQAGGRDIIDTFRPDPMPKSDMNIARGFPQFVSHAELERGGFIVDDTIFIECTVDSSTIRHPQKQ